MSDAEQAYVAKLGGTYRPTPGTSGASGVRRAVLDTLWARTRGEPVPENPRRRSPLWLPRYFVKRVAWHALDHTWEIEDRSIR